ncbi:hypothetical protein JI59_08805 [Novosphingobium pentaromativorans US6-1]|nr:hypothetical protein JI59_08805 [Novosphingobium pentaromativorans US6-1]
MPEYDLVIRSGTVADGTGAPLRETDVAVSDGRIVAVGEVAGSGRDEMDARGLLITPGFIDLHTHYDAQLCWSEVMDPSSGHGVTTVVTGNCGVGFAPCSAENRDYLIRLMEGVEDIPEAVMAEGLPWNWESFGDYLDSIERRPHDIDFAVLLPHAPLRVAAMGRRAVDLEPATAQDRAKMRSLAREAMLAGGAGFSSSRSMYHQSSRGESIASLKAGDDELREIAMGLADAGRGVLQAITIDGRYHVEEYEALHRISDQTKRPVSYTLLELPSNQGLWREVLAAVDRDVAKGIDIRLQVFNRPVGVVLGLEASFNPFIANPFYVAELAPLPLSKRVKAMREPEVRARLIADAGNLQHPMSKSVTNYENMYALGEYAEYEPSPETSVAALARARGVPPLAVALDILLENEGRGKLLVTASNFVHGNLDTTLEMMQHDRSVVALGDGGAHYGLVCDASYPTYMLTHWARDRWRGERLDLATAVRMLTKDPAQLQRLHDRGRLAPGMKADINVIDFDRLKLRSPDIVHDLPNGGKRLAQQAEGYVATFVSGQAIRRNGESTAARPGQLVRNAGI